MKNTGLMKPEEAARLLGVSRNTFNLMLAKNQLPTPVMVGNRKFWHTDTFKAWIKSGFKNKDGK